MYGLIVLFSSCHKKIINDPVLLNPTISNWSKLGGNAATSLGSPITCMYLDATGNLYVSANYAYWIPIQSDKYSMSYIAKWNGTNWTQLGGQTLNANGSINTICGDTSGNIYAAGQFSDTIIQENQIYSYPSGNNYVAKWNGISWVNLGGKGSLKNSSGPAESIIPSIALNPTNGYLYAAGYYPATNSKVAYYNNSAWVYLDNTSNLNGGGISQIMFSKTGDLYSCGSFTNTNGKCYVAKWNGTTWSELGGVNALNANGSINAMCIDASGNIYVAGNFSYNMSSNQSLYVAKWDGNTWSIIGYNYLFAPAYAGYSGGIQSLVINSSGTIFAAGGSMVGANNSYYVGRYP
jgi:hypothetical protein